MGGKLAECIHVCMTESLCCSPETISTMLIGYTPMQNKKLKEKELCFGCVQSERPSWQTTLYIEGGNYHNIVKSVMLYTQSCLTLATPWTIASFLCPWNFPGKNTGVGCHFLLQKYWSTREVPNLWTSLCSFFLSAALPCEIWPPCCNHMDYRVHGVL